MNDESVAAVEGQDREFEESTAPVEAQDKLFGGHVIVSLADPVPESRGADPHAT